MRKFWFQNFHKRRNRRLETVLPFLHHTLIINIPDLEYTGLFAFDTIVLLGDNSLETTVYVEIKKHSGSNIITEPIKPIIVNERGVGFYMNVSSAVSHFAKDEYIEILVYADSYKQNLITRQFIRPVTFSF